MGKLYSVVAEVAHERGFILSVGYFAGKGEREFLCPYVFIKEFNDEDCAVNNKDCAVIDIDEDEIICAMQLAGHSRYDVYRVPDNYCKSTIECGIDNTFRTLYVTIMENALFKR